MDTKTQVRDFILKNYYVADPTSLRDDSLLVENGIIDSTGVMELVLFLESSFGVSVADEEMSGEYLGSIERIARFVEARARRAAASA